MQNQDFSIIKEISSVKRSYDTTIDIVDGLKFRQRDLIKTIEFFTNSKYQTGQSDEMGEKPYFNVLNAIEDVENAYKRYRHKRYKHHIR